jgi:hypothetical protein
MEPQVPPALARIEEVREKDKIARLEMLLFAWQNLPFE